jgi:hypothetical protein
MVQRLYFDLYEGASASRDSEGELFADTDTARQAAVQSLLELMRHHPVEAEAVELMYAVRDASDRTIFTAQLLVRITTAC